MSTNMEVWQSFNQSIFTDTTPDGLGEVEGLIWQKPNGQWIMLVGDPSTPGRVMSVSVSYNPWTGEELQAQREAKEK